MNKKWLGMILIALLFGVMAFGFLGTGAWFSDIETSNGNELAAGTLDLNIDGGNTNVVKFTFTNMKPESQPKGTYTLANVGTINGFLDMEDITVASYENICLDPETDEGDITCGNPGEGKGELQDVVNLRLFLDDDCNGWIGAEDDVFFNDLVNALPGNFELDVPINAGNSVCITAIFDWWSTADDNLAQSDSLIFDITFELAQTAGQ